MGSVVSGQFDSVSLRIEALGFARDELEVFGRVFGKAWLNGQEQLVVGSGARDDAADGGKVPVEV